jgi:hypothetical protein
VEVTLGEIHVGPVITRYEVVPVAGVRVEKIERLEKDIALGMRAQSIRVIAPIPGKAAVGVEVPNRHPTPVRMRELLESEDWAGIRAEILIALGKDVSGRPLIFWRLHCRLHDPGLALPNLAPFAQNDVHGTRRRNVFRVLIAEFQRVDPPEQ